MKVVEIITADHSVEKGKVEVKGIDFIPETERNSRPLNVFFVLGGAQLCFSVMIIGGLPVVFGLGWWDSFWAITAGLLLGSLLIAPMALLGQKTGTNGPVSSGAHFGIKGRAVGAVLTVFVSLGFYALTVWTGAQSLIYSAHKLLGWPESNGVLAVGAILISVTTSIVATYGHSIIVVIEKIGTWLIGAILVATIFVLMPEFDPGYEGGAYLLGGYWQTWLLSASLALSIPVSCATFINDYSRYIPSRTSARSLMFGTGAGMFTGCWIGMIVAAYVTTMFADLNIPLVQGMIELVPGWFVVPLVLVGVIGSLTQGSFALYGAGLGLESLGLGANRVIPTVAMSILGFAVVMLIVFVYDATSLINAFVTIILVAISPWLTINLVGYFYLRGLYNPQQLHLKDGGMYWYKSGYNLSAMLSWTVAVIIGLMFTSTAVFTGPLVQFAGGMDISFVSSAIIAALLYYLLIHKFMDRPGSVLDGGVAESA